MDKVTIGRRFRQRYGPRAAIGMGLGVAVPVIEQFGSRIESDDILDWSFGSRGDAANLFDDRRIEGNETRQIAAGKEADVGPRKGTSFEKAAVDRDAPGDSVTALTADRHASFEGRAGGLDEGERPFHADGAGRISGTGIRIPPKSSMSTIRHGSPRRDHGKSCHAADRGESLPEGALQF